MAKKSIISKTRKSLSTPWLNNAVKSLGGLGNEVLADIAPNLHDVTTSSTKAIINTAKTIKGSSSNSIMSSLKGNKYVKASNTAMTNIIEDLKKGNFNNEDRIMAVMMGDSGDDSGGMSFDDWDESSSDMGSSISFGDDSGSETQMTLAITDELQKGTIAQVQAQKASMDNMVALSSAHMAQQAEISSKMIGHLENIQSGIEALVEFNRSNMTDYMEKSIAYMDRVGQSVDQFVGSSDKLTASSVYRNNAGGIKVDNYKNLVKQNLGDYLKGGELGGALSLLGDNLDMLTANPLGMITKLAITQITPKMLKNSIESLDETFAGFIPTMLSKIADLGDSYETGMMGNAKRAFGKIFGAKSKRKDQFNMENRITDKTVAFDQITRHAITELIPKYLREQTAYLKDMARSMGVDTRKSLQGSSIFDYQSGTYTSLGRAQELAYGQIRDTTINQLNNSKFGNNLRTNNTLTNSKDINEYNAMLDNFFVSLEKHGKFLDVTNQSAGSDLDKIIKSLGSSQGMENYLRAALQLSANDPSLSLSANTGIQNAINSRNNTIKSMEDDPAFYNLYSMELGESIDESIQNTFNTTMASNADVRKNGTINSIMNDIRFLLNRGINVRIEKGPSYASMSGFTTSQTISSSVITGSNTPSTSSVNRHSNPNEDPSILDGNMSVEEYTKHIKENQYDLNPKISNTTTHLQNAMSALAFGSGSQAMTELSKIFTENISKLFGKINDDYIKPLKTTIFGSRDENKYSRDGLFSGIQNKAFDAYKFFQREFTGKGYTDADGNKFADKKDGDPSVLGNIKNTFKTIKDSVTDYIFGEKIEEGENAGKRNKKTGSFIGSAMSTLKEGFDGWADFIFGKNEDGERKHTLERLKNSISEKLPDAVSGGLGGAVFGIMSGGSLLGTLIGGPIGGAVIGATTGILSKNEKFQEWLFGKTDENTGERLDTGLISTKVQQAFKDNKTAIIGGAGLGLMKSIILGGGGMLGGIVGGPIAGAAIGATVGIVTKSDAFQKFLYGDSENGWNKGIIPMINGIFKGNKSEDATDDLPKGSKLIGMAALGTLGGGLTASMVGSMGLLGAMATPFGPIGGALAGLALSINASKNGFREYLFGKGDGEDHKAGLFEKFGNMINVEVVEPFRFGMMNFFEDGKDFIIDKMIAPVEFAIEPFAQGLKNVATTIQLKVEDFAKKIGKDIYDKVIDPIVRNTQKFIISPMVKTFGMLFKGFTGIAKTIIATPFDMLAQATNFMDARNKSDSRRKVKEENLQNDGLLRGTLKNLGISFRIGDAREEASHKYVDYEDYDERKRAYKEDFERRKGERIANRDERKRISRNHQTISRMTGGERFEDTDENRAYAQQVYDEQRSKNRIFRWHKDLKFIGDASDNKVNNEDTALSNDQLEKSADDPKASTQNRLLGQVIRIADAITGKFGGKKKKKKDKDDNDNIPDIAEDEEVQPLGLDGVLNTLLDAGNVRTSAANILSGIMTRAITPAKSAFKGSFAEDLFKEGMSAFEKIFPKFADGGTSDGGVAVVGERGPELVNLPKGARITPHEQAINVNISNITQTAAKTLANVTTGRGPSIKGTKSKYDEIRKEGSYENIQAEKKEQREEERAEELLDAVQAGNEEQKHHHSIWDSIFSKKGLITGAILLAIPIITKLFGSLPDILKGIVGNIGGSISNVIANMTENFGKNLEDGKGPIEQAKGIVEDTTQLFETGDIMEWIFPDGETNNESGAKLNLLAHTPQFINKALKTPFGKAVTGSVKGATNTIKGIGKVGLKVAGGIDNGIGTAINLGSDALNVAKNGGIRNFMDTAKSFKAAGVADNATDALRMAADNIGVTLRSADEATNPSFIKAIKGVLTSVWDNIAGAIAKHGGKVGTKSLTFIDDIVEFCVKHSAKISAKVAPLLGTKGAVAATGYGAVALAVLEVTSITLSAINGVSGTARLFAVDPSAVDTWMTVISGAMGALVGSTPGSVLDIINEFSVSITGIDIIQNIAMLAYDLVVSDTDYSKLMTAQSQWKNLYETERNQQIGSQYQAHLAANGLTSDQFTLADYEAKLKTGELSADVTSFANWNDNKNKTLGSKVMDGIKGIGKTMTTGWGYWKDMAVGKTETTFNDSHGNLWTKGEGDMYNVYDKSGNFLGQQHKDNINSTFTSNEQTTKGFLSPVIDGGKNIGSTITTGATNLWNGIKGFGSGIVDGAKNVGGAVIGGIDDFGKGVMDIFNHAKDAVIALPEMSKAIADSYTNGDDFTTYMDNDITGSISDENPFKNILNTLGNGLKLVQLPGMVVGGIAKKVMGKVSDTVSTMVDVVSDQFTTITNELTKIPSFIKDGNLKGLFRLKLEESDNPLSFIGKTVLTGAKILTAPPTAISAAGHLINDKVIQPVIKAISNVATQSASNYTQLTSYVDNGDISGLIRHKNQADESPLSWIVKGVGVASKMILAPITTFNYVKGVVNDKVIQPVTSAISSVAEQSSSNYNNLLDYSNTGDIVGLMHHNIQVDESPLSWIVKGVGVASKMILAPSTAFKFIGGKISGVIDNVTSSVSTAGGDISTNTSNMMSLMTSGDIKGLLGYKSQVSDNNGIMQFAVNAMTVGGKVALALPTAFSSVTKIIGEKIDSVISFAKDTGTDVKNYVSDVSAYLDITKDISGMSNLKLGGDDPVSMILNSVVGTIMKIFVNTVRGVKEAAKFVTDIPGNIWDAGVNAVNTGVTNVMNWGRGGKGGRNLRVIQGGKGSDIPYYSQNDPRWKNNSYGNETMGESGCGTTAMAMVASGMNGGSGNSPIDFAKYSERKGYRDETGTNWNFVDSASRDSGLSANKQYRPTESFINSELDSGHPVILSGQGGSGSPYTSQGHYVVATGKDRNGNIMINDPRGKEYSGAYPMEAVSGGANVGWGMSKNRSGMVSGGRNLSTPLDNMIKTTTMENLATTTGASTPTTKPTTMMGGISNPLSLASATHTNNDLIKANSVGTSLANTGMTMGGVVSGVLSSGSLLDQARAAIVGTMLQLQGKLKYSQQSDRETVLDALTKGHAAGDCSSTCYHLYKSILGINIGTYTGAQITNKSGIDVDTNAGGIPDESKLLPGDLLYFRKKGSSNVGHVEMYIGNGQLAGHGGPGNGPTLKDMREYCTSRNNADKGYMKTRRWIYDGAVNSVSLPNGGSYASGLASGTSTTTTVSSKPMTIFETLGSFFTQFGEKAMNGLLTGHWDTNYVFGNSPSSVATSSATQTTGSTTDFTSIPVTSGDTPKQVWDFFKALGYSDQAVAGILGNMQQESRVEPDLIQGNGKGPAAGIVQWENWKTKSSRWKEMADYAASKNKDWTDLRSQLEHVENELNGKSANGYTHMTWSRAKRVAGEQNKVPYASLAEFKSAKDIPGATLAFQEAFERPNWDSAHYDKRVNYANQYYNQFAGGGRGGDPGDTNQPVKAHQYLLNTDKITKLKNANPTGRLTKKAIANDDGVMYVVGGGRGNDRKQNEDLWKYESTRKSGGKGDLTDGLLSTMITLLEKIASATLSSDQKLSLLKDISKGGLSVSKTNVSSNPVIVPPQEQIIMPQNSKPNTATKIAQGF